MASTGSAGAVVEFIETTGSGAPSTINLGTTINSINLINLHKLHQLNEATGPFIRLIEVDGVYIVDAGLTVFS